MILEATGIYSAYETEWRQGFNIGLAYATKGTGKVNGRKIDVNWDDDADNPTTAVTDFKSYVGAGYKIIGGSQLRTRFSTFPARPRMTPSLAQIATPSDPGVKRIRMSRRRSPTFNR